MPIVAEQISPLLSLSRIISMLHDKLNRIKNTRNIYSDPPLYSFCPLLIWTSQGLTTWWEQKIFPGWRRAGVALKMSDKYFWGPSYNTYICHLFPWGYETLPFRSTGASANSVGKKMATPTLPWHLGGGRKYAKGGPMRPWHRNSHYTVVGGGNFAQEENSNSNPNISVHMGIRINPINLYSHNRMGQTY